MSPIFPDTSPPVMPDVVSADVGEEGLYGNFSPRAMTSLLPFSHVLAASESVDMAPVMLLMPKLQGLCGESTPPLSVMHLEVASPVPSVATSMPPLTEPDQPLVSIDSDALFAKELCWLLVSLEAAIPGSDKEIVRLLSGKDTCGKIEKVNEYFKSKIKKCVPQGGRRQLLDGWAHLFGSSCSRFLLFCSRGVFLVRW